MYLKKCPYLVKDAFSLEKHYGGHELQLGVKKIGRIWPLVTHGANCRDWFGK